VRLREERACEPVCEYGRERVPSIKVEAEGVKVGHVGRFEVVVVVMAGERLGGATLCVVVELAVVRVMMRVVGMHHRVGLERLGVLLRGGVAVAVGKDMSMIFLVVGVV
jgi:hypothetical protein